ncbi:MAG: adenylate/guanylate cyclase domain-containing protein [Rhodocyclaceae bacterium]|nr:adenylate/guanylate cyclase domain-containing protein [Rhodocyclaceae bacterium]
MHSPAQLIKRAYAALMGGGRRDMQLPARVRRAFEHEQYRSEILVTCVQLALAALLAQLYASAPPGFSPDAPIEAAPLGLALFSILSALRLYFALTGQLKRWMLGASVVAEMLVLLFVIWAYHLQYEQPAQLSLKSTQLVYVFMLISLRALRFEPVWVLLSGATAALGWVAMVANAYYRAPANPVTWDYVTSLRSMQIHWGGEVDKVLAIVVVTLVLALALRRARAMLEQSVSQQLAVQDLSLFFDDSVANRITGSEQAIAAGQGELRQAAVLFLDLRGFTEASASLTPSELIALLGEYQRLAVPVIRKHGGNIDKFMGDGILASFGAAMPDASYAAHALAAVDDIMASVDAWREARRAAGKSAPDVGGGLATGEVVFGIIGDGQRLEYTVIGDTVNLAAKLEKHNKAEKTRAITTRTALELAHAQGYTGSKEIRAQRNVGGVPHPLDVAVLAHRPGASGQQAAA